MHVRWHPMSTLRGFAARINPLALAFLILALPSAAHSASPIPEELRGATITEKLGASVSVRDLVFTDEAGEKVHLSKYFQGFRPVILNLVYYGCPSLCGYFLKGFTDSLKGLDWTAGDRFEIITVSIDHREDHELASAKKDSILELLGRPAASKGWHFLTGDEVSIRKLADEVGFGFKYDEKQKEYAHSAAAILLTPDARVSRYLYGISFQSKDLKLGLLEASSGKIGNMLERALLFCYRYDPSARGYSLAVMRMMQAGSAGTVLAFGGFIAVFWRRQRRNSKEV